jgi:ribosomal protein L29
MANSDARTQLTDTQIALKMSESDVAMLKEEVKTLKDELADLTANGAVEDLCALTEEFVKEQRREIADTWERLKTERTEVEVWVRQI